jgi:pimeloyl-ACP methyl ester carboxylesterase
LQRLQAHAIRFLQLPVIRQVADVTFSQLVLKVSAEMGDSEAFDPEPVAAAHEHRVLAINMTHGNLEALAGEYLAAGGVVEQIDHGLGAIRLPAVVIQGSADHLVNPVYGRRLAAALPDAHLVMVGGGHMVPYTHPAAVAAAVRSVAGARGPALPAGAPGGVPRPRRARRLSAEILPLSSRS